MALKITWNMGRLDLLQLLQQQHILLRLLIYHPIFLLHLIPNLHKLTQHKIMLLLALLLHSLHLFKLHLHLQKCTFYLFIMLFQLHKLLLYQTSFLLCLSYLIVGYPSALLLLFSLLKVDFFLPLREFYLLSFEVLLADFVVFFKFVYEVLKEIVLFV